MNINIDIVNRALEAAGQERLVPEEMTAERESTRWRLVRDIYLQVILTTLAKTTWTSRIKRAKLEPLTETENLSGYFFQYILPYDCVRPEALNGNDEYIVEGHVLYTDREEAILQYVSSARRDPLTERTEEELSEDYPDYDEITFDATLQECIEYQLAAKIALKITGNADLANYLFSQAMVYEAEAKKATLEHYHSKEQGESWWGDMMGLSVEGKTR